MSDSRPISRENRVKLLQSGMVFDELIHAFPAIDNIVDVKTSIITNIKAAQYENAEIQGETFISCNITMRSKINHQNIPVTIHAGKGVGNISSFKIHRNYMHMIVLRGYNNKMVSLSMEGSLGQFLSEKNECIEKFILPDKYKPVISNLFLHNAKMGQSLDEALVNIRIATEIKSEINSYVKTNKFPTYRVGTTQYPAPSLEEILNNTPSVYDALVPIG